MTAQTFDMRNSIDFYFFDTNKITRVDNDQIEWTYTHIYLIFFETILSNFLRMKKESV